jgi:hypothetical protein
LRWLDIKSRLAMKSRIGVHRAPWVPKIQPLHVLCSLCDRDGYAL